MDEDTELLLAALNLLIASDDAPHMYSSLEAVARLRIAHNVAFTDITDLNVLIPIARHNPERFRQLVALVDAKRREALKAPLVAEDKGFDKSDYMREFMYQKRQRQRRAVEIENMARKGTDRLVGHARLKFMEHEASRWKTRLDAMLAAARGGGARLPRSTMDQLRGQFWAQIDKELDEREAQERLKILTR